MFNRKPNQTDADGNSNPEDMNSADDLAFQDQERQEIQENLSSEVRQQEKTVLPELTKPSVISEGFEFTGDVNFQGTLNVDGSVSGSVTVQNLLIGSSGKVNGSINASTIQVRGSFTGDAICKDLTIGGQANVNAKINYSSLTIQRGAMIQGELTKS
jgi:cytoskeletal protein CcmA (bactofilin family)